VSYLYHHIHKNSVEIILPATVGNWSTLKHTNRIPRPIKEWRQRRLLAFTVFHDKPGHWTLAIAVNMNYNAGIDNSPNISVFHFDSLPIQTKSIAFAEEYARYAFQLTKAEKSKAFEIPVPFQPASSNDCGLYPAHFLKIFLKDIDKAIEFCVKVG
jgi:hypothetical protein